MSKYKPGDCLKSTDHDIPVLIQDVCDLEGVAGLSYKILYMYVKQTVWYRCADFDSIEDYVGPVSDEEKAMFLLKAESK